jgi:hypothetical protein
MRPHLWLLLCSGCSLVVDYEPDDGRHDGAYVLEGALEAESCQTPSASTVRLNIEIRGSDIAGPFSCPGAAVVTEASFDRVWECLDHRALLSGMFEAGVMAGVYTLRYPTCERRYVVRGGKRPLPG